MDTLVDYSFPVAAIFFGVVVLLGIIVLVVAGFRLWSRVSAARRRLDAGRHGQRRRRTHREPPRPARHERGRRRHLRQLPEGTEVTLEMLQAMSDGEDEGEVELPLGLILSAVAVVILAVRFLL